MAINTFYPNYIKQFSAIQDRGLFFQDRYQGEKFYSYQQIYLDMGRWSKQLEHWLEQEESSHDLKQTKKQQKTMALLLPNSYELVQLFLSSQLLRVTPAALYPPQGLNNFEIYLKELERQLSLLRPSLIILPKALKSIIGSLQNKIAAQWIAVEDFFPGPLTEIDPGRMDSQLARITPEDWAFIQFSSGTTGPSKPSVILHRQLEANLKQIAEGLKLEVGKDVGVTWLPLYHDMGLVGGLYMAMASLSTTTVLRPEEFLTGPSLWVKTIEQKKASIIVAPNFAYGLVAKKYINAEATAPDLSSVRVALCGAEQVSEETLNQFIAVFSPRGFRPESLLPVYGMSEATLAVSFPALNQGPRYIYADNMALEKGVLQLRPPGQGVALCSVGQALNNIHIQIFTEREDGSYDEAPLAEGTIGEVGIKGPNIVTQRLDGELSLVNGFYMTGDRGVLHQGSLYILGRKKDVVIIRGRNIDSAWAEQSLFQIQSELAGLRLGRWALRSGLKSGGESSTSENIYFFCELERPVNIEREKALRNTIENFFKSNFSMAPLTVVFVASGSLPRTSSGKIRRAETLRLYLQGRLTSRFPWSESKGLRKWKNLGLYVFYRLKALYPARA